MMRHLLIFLSLLTGIETFSQPLQTLRGTVIDEASGSAVSYASVILLKTSPTVGATTDSLGHFSMDIPVGRYDVQVSHIDYETALILEVTVSSVRQTVLTIAMKQHVQSLAEIVVQPRLNKEHALNPMATVSARMLSVEEAKRYAGGFDDPARLASSFAGVAGNTDVNGIIVRGNAPKFVQWKMEGIEIPNPNHFGDLKLFGGGALTALSSQMLANSDFFTGAFPAEYNNALSGIFDFRLRKGNNQKKENTFQVGVIGIDASSEGPFRKGGKSSYLYNYRYSTLGLLQPLLPDNANSLKYQDLSFKLFFPTRKAGEFSLWGIGLLDQAGAKAKTDSTLWVYQTDRQQDQIHQYMGAVGFSHRYALRKQAYWKTTLAATLNGTDWKTQKMDQQLVLQPYSTISNNDYHLVLSSFLNTKFSAKHMNKTGLLLTGMGYMLSLDHATPPGNTPSVIVDAQGFTTLISVYSSSSIQLNDRLVLNAGVNAQYFTLNNHYTLEPRLGLKQQFCEKHSLGIAYGLHSRLEKLNFYFNNSLKTGARAVNKNLDFTKAHHVVLSYDWKLSQHAHLRLEPYYQYLFNVPVIADSSFSLLNLQGDWFFAALLQNTGKGRNYGIDFTLEKFISKGYYYLLTASLFRSEYLAGDQVWRDTRYNRNYVINALIGKEWQVGRQKQNVISLNTRIVYQGGERYTPVNLAASQAAQAIVYNENQAFSQASSPTLNIHFTASYRINKKRTSQELALKILNATGQPNFYGFQYNYVNHTADKDLASVVIPNISYRIEF